MNMAQSKKPRKRYKPKSRAELVSVNPVSMSIDRKRLNRSRVDTLIEMELMQDWQHCPSLLQGVAEAIAMAIKTIEGWDDENGLGDVMVDAMDIITELSSQGHIWRTGKKAEMLIQAFDEACQILMGQPPREKLKAWVWAQAVNLSVQAEMSDNAEA